MKKTFPELFKQTSTGKVQVWKIWTEDNVIHEEYGLQDGKKQHITDTVKVGKNIGRSNETTPIEQAQFEANAKWVKKSEKDYREDIDEIAEARTTSSAGGALPMLAHKYKDNKKKVIFPCFCQPKLDGLRCSATRGCDGRRLWFRSGKEINTMGHIQDALAGVIHSGDMFDGELYIHNADFNKIGGSIRRDKHIKEEEAVKVEYHIYDFPSIAGLSDTNSYADRLAEFNKVKVKWPLIRVRTDIANNEQEIMELYSQYMADGYEGIMIRNMDSVYAFGKRSRDLLKFKEFDDEEFEIIGYEEGRGRLQGAVKSFICDIPKSMRIPGGREKFSVKMDGEGVTELMKDYFKHPKKFMNKMLTVRYQGVSKEYGCPRFPVGKGIRFDK